MKHDPKHIKVGKYGEDVACRFLMKRGFSIVGRNYLKKWGELDIIAKNKGTICFVEVKTISRDLSAYKEGNQGVKHETESFRAEENVHSGKIERLKRTIETYLLENNIKDNWSFGVVAVYLDLPNKLAKVSFLEDVVL
jgi:putative endonuclease